MEKKILKNAILCLKCGDLIESTSVHDFKFCTCQACAVDGGHDYLRRIGNKEDWIDDSVVIEQRYLEEIGEKEADLK